MHDDVQPNYVSDSHANYMSDSNMIPYDQYEKDNAVPVVQSNVSSIPNDAYMMKFNDMHELHAQSVSDTTRNTVVDNSLTAKLATYKEQVELYKRWAKFELMEIEQKIDEQLRIVITDRNIKEENLKKELHSVKMKLASTINHNKSMVEEVTSLKKDFKQKENKYLEEFFDMKALKEKNKVAICYMNPLCLTRAKQVQPALYNGYEIIKNNHVPALVYNTEDTLEIAEITRRKMNDKMKDPECVTHKVKIAPPNYSKENYLETFTSQKQLTPEQIFWSRDLIKMKEEALKKQTTASRPIKALTVIKEMKEIFDELEAEVDQNVMNRKYDEIEWKNLLIANDNLIADCLSKEVLYVATNSELTVSRLTEMHDAHTVVQARCLELEAELFELKDKIQKDDHNYEADRTIDFRALDFQITQLNEKVIVLHEQNELFRVENAKIKQHYKELYDSIKITRVKHIEQTTALLTNNENLKTQIHENLKAITMDSVKPRVLAPGVNCYTEASRSKPRSNTKKNRISPAENVNKKKVKEHPRTNKTSLKSTNHIDSSISSKRIVVQIILWYLNSGYSKHMMGDRSRLRNFMKKFIRTVRFRNDHFCAIMGYGDYVIDESVMSRVYYVEGQGHNLFFVRKFCDSDLEVAFRKHSCYVRDTDGVELIKCSRRSNLYTISVEDMMKSPPICLLSKASKNKSWLWHHRLNHLNFGTINDLTRKDLVSGLSRLKFEKDHLCSACQLGKSKKHTHSPKTENTNLEVLNIIHIDLCGPMRVQTINRKKYILVIVDDYSRTSQQNGIVDRRNRTLVEAARTMLIFSKALMFLWAEVVATAFFGALCYPTNDSEDLRKLQPTTDIGIFVGYAPSRKGYRIYNKRTRRIMETIHVQFDELSEPMAHVQLSTGPVPTFLTPGQISSGLVPNPVPVTPYVSPTNKELEILFQPMFDEYLKPPCVERPVFPGPAVPVPVNSAGTPSSTTIGQDAPSPSHSPSSSALQSPSSQQGVAAGSTIIKDNHFAYVDNNPFANVFALEPSSEASSSGDVSSEESTHVTQLHHHLRKWSKDHPLDNVIFNPSRPVSTR
ncbi:retrovirus-related pol polyprotein from transposon TNT 1-94 [Tanacetum coccineum]